ncbi:ABC transporter ATP-binding protein [Microbacterium sp. RD1]|uniref:ABC transporter ATP-binding protein n=1 Tax=Microbacterium sp. RD1 TaxID=3457313 RepID=UPI003FA543F7
MPEPVTLRTAGLVKSFPDRDVIGGLDLSIRAGEFSVVLGPSGAGKTTLLRCLSGLTPVTSGVVEVGGTPVRSVPRDVAVVFQDYNRSLYPWLTLERNVTFGLRGVSRGQARARAREALDRVGLADAADLHPWEVSGGMQQRATIARAIAAEAGLVIMDEPFASVDALTKVHLEQLLLKIWHETPFTCVFVTHDIEEAVYLADRLFVLSPRPSTLREEIVVDLPRPRDPLATKALPRFQELRTHVYGLIEGVGASGISQP